jgi:hypothetical protein
MGHVEEDAEMFSGRPVEMELGVLGMKGSHGETEGPDGKGRLHWTTVRVASVVGTCHPEWLLLAQ